MKFHFRIGYKTQEYKLNLERNINKNINFDIESFTVGEIQVRGKANIVNKN